MHILFLTGSRGEWGYIRPILRLCQSRGIDYSICATNMHVLPSFGMTVDEIRKDGFEVEDEIYMALDGYNHYTMAKSMGILQMSFTDVLSRQRPDWIVLAGDRAETLIGAIVGAYTYTPIAHIQAGELSGNIDGQARHAIGKFAHIHFASNQDAADRLIRLGEEDFRIKMVGAPQLDELIQSKYTVAKELSLNLGFDVLLPFILVVQHPVTEEFNKTEEHIVTTLEALDCFDMPKVWILPNNDAGGDIIKGNILKARTMKTYIFSNLPRQDYLGLLKTAKCIIGNSSSGLLEAPTFELPAVNIGRRQAARVCGVNVINVPEYDTVAIENGIHKALSSDFHESIRGCENPYGNGDSSGRILDILTETYKDDRLLVKKLTY